MFDINRRNIISLNLIGLLLVTSNLVLAQLKDPTRPPISHSSGEIEEDNIATGWTLSSILVSPQRRVAIINGKAVTTGETLAGAKVVSINEKSVKLEFRGEVIVINLLPKKIKAMRDSGNKK